ncbi:guanine nucleotide binding protein, alpha subunit [Favolaschia claudopus]|uniref:Guanine nucleotide binding protein, alpha subunit n=1 Tax=Favolaschia claudopus TaxID=2862362 RepID=A0AAW0AWT6_9AGAR
MHLNIFHHQQQAKSEATARNEEIERRIKSDLFQSNNEIDILLLGTIQSSPEWQTTLLRQFKALREGYSKSEREAYKVVILNNVIQGMCTILQAMPQLNLHASPENEARRDQLLSYAASTEFDAIPPAIADIIRALWKDTSVQEAVGRGAEFVLADGVVYLGDSIDRLAAADYLPTDEDILHARVRDTGVREISFKVGDLRYRIFDPIGQRSERRKWIHFFQDVTAVLFCTDLGQYDQCLYEDKSVNELTDALTIFDSVCNSRWFQETNIILFLRVDTLAEKLPRIPLSDYFPDYEGGNNYDAACDYLLHRFVSLDQHAAKRQIYANYASVADPQQVKFIFSAVQDITLNIHLRKKGKI